MMLLVNTSKIRGTNEPANSKENIPKKSITAGAVTAATGSISFNNFKSQTGIDEKGEIDYNT